MADYLVRILAREAGVRGFACFTTESVNEAIMRHKTQPTAAVALSRALTGVALMGALLKVKQRVALKFEGNGPLEKVLAEADAYGRVRGYVGNPDVNLTQADGQPDIINAIGQAGLLTVVRDLRLKELSESVIPLAVSDFQGDLIDYFDQSEQIRTTIQLGEVLTDDGRVQVSGGLLIQDIPTQGEDDTIIQLQERLQELPPISAFLKDGKTPEEILAILFEGIEYDILEKRDVQFQCDCSWDRSRQALMTLGMAELQQMIDSDEDVIINCHYCHQEYLFNEFELEVLLMEMAAED